MVNMMILIINKMYMISVIILLFHYSCVHGLPFGNKNPHQLHENHVPHSSHDSHNVTPTSSNPRRSIFSNILKYNGIFVPKTPIRLLPKFGSVIDGSLKTKLFRWPKENTIEVKPIELSTFLKKVPKIAESLWPDSGKLIAKPFPLKNLQNYQLLDINGLNGHHDQPFSDGTYMEIPPPSTLSSPSSIKSIPPHLNQNQRPPNKNQNKPTPLFGKDSDLFSSDFDLMTNDKFPEKTNGFHLLRPPPFSATGSSLFSPLIPGLNELLDFDRPFKPEPLLPRPISQPMDLFRPRPIHLGGPGMRPQMFPPMLNNGNQQMNNNINNNNNHNKPCTTNGNNNQNNFNSNGNNMNSNGNSNNNNINNIQSSSNNNIVTKPSNVGQNSIKSTITESRQGPIIFYRFDDPQIKTIPKDQLFPIFIPNPDTSGQTTKMEVIIQKQETVASTRAPALRHRRRNRHKLRDDHDDFDDNVVDNSHRDRLTSVAASDDVDYADEYADDLSGYDLKESDNLEIFEDEEPPDNSKQKKIRTNHRKYSDSPRSTSSSSASRIIKYQAIESNKPHRQRLTARPRLRFRSDTVRSDTVRIKPQASSVHNSRLMRGSHGLRHATVPLNSNSGGIGGSGSGGGGGGGGGGNIGTSNIATGEISGLSLSSGDPNKVSRENKVKTGDRTTFDKGIERSKHRVFEQKQEEIWKEKKWNKGGKENTEVESVGTVTEKDKRGARGLQQKSRILRYGDKQLRSDDEKAYYDDDLGNNNEGEIPNGEDDRDGEEDNARASQIDQRYTKVTWSPEIHSSGWKKSHHSV